MIDLRSPSRCHRSVTQHQHNRRFGTGPYDDESSHRGLHTAMVTGMPNLTTLGIDHHHYRAHL